ncbi:MAG: DUF305 domain-containing protein [Gemmatimonadota bacterium]
MHRTIFPARRALLALGVATLSSACATASGGVSAETSTARVGPDAAEAARLEAIYWSQVEGARNRFTEADVDFMVGMIGHHAQALVMAGLVPERSRSPAVQTLARRIDNAQRDEIKLMEQWLQTRGQPVPHWRVEGSTLVFQAGGEATGEHEMAGHEMAGMLTPQQLDELESASETRFDELFLRFMIQHHEGAVEMVRTLFATDGAAQDTDVFRFASDVQVDQATEIARMERMLQEMSSTGESPG